MVNKPGKPPSGLWRYNPETPEGKYLLTRRDGTIPEWPFFALGAKDPCSAVALRAYANEADRLGYNAQYVMDVLRLAEEFEQYRMAHGDGDPDRGRHRPDDPRTIELMKKGKSA